MLAVFVVTEQAAVCGAGQFNQEPRSFGREQVFYLSKRRLSGIFSGFSLPFKLIQREDADTDSESADCGKTEIYPKNGFVKQILLRGINDLYISANILLTAGAGALVAD
jgi:hypothetical protein